MIRKSLINYLLEGEIKHINYIKSKNIPMYMVTSIKDKINKNEYSIDVCTVTFSNIIAPIKNLLEMVNISKAEVARNPAWHIF